MTNSKLDATFHDPKRAPIPGKAGRVLAGIFACLFAVIIAALLVSLTALVVAKTWQAIL